MNKITIVGRATKDIELRKTASGKTVATFCVAVPRKSFEEADFINCIVWNKVAEIMGTYVKKGNRIGISGRLQSRTYDRDGNTMTVHEVYVEEFEFLEPRKKEAEPLQPQKEVYEEGGARFEAEYDLPF